MTEKPILYPESWANYANTLDPASDEYKAILERPPQSKIDDGWVYGEKPSHKYFNWNWKLIDEYIHHVNANGIPKWDSVTAYEIGSITVYNPNIYQALTDNQNKPPIDNTGTDWKIIGQYIETMDDVSITHPSDTSENHILRWENTNLWENINIDSTISTLSLNDLKDVSLGGTLTDGDLLMYDESIQMWRNASPSETLQRDSIFKLTYLSDVVNGLQPNLGGALKYDGFTWHVSNQILENDKINWADVTDVPDELQIGYASETDLGGGKIYELDGMLKIIVVPEGPPDNPESLTVMKNSSNEIIIYWTSISTELPYYFNVYRNTNLYKEGVLDSSFLDYQLDENTEYSYFVTAVNDKGESKPSNTVIANTYSEPSPPYSLYTKTNGTEVSLYWGPPVDDSYVEYYNVYRNGNLISSTGSTMYIDSNVSYGNTYTYYVTAVNKYYESNQSNIITVKI